MNKYQLAFIFGCSAGVFFVLSSWYNAQFNNEWEFEFDENFIGDLTLLRKDGNDETV